MSNEITSTTSASSVSYYTGKESAPAGFRLVRTSWKQTTDKAGKVTPARKTVCCAIPATSIAVEPQALQDALQGAYNDMQDDLIRSIIEMHEDGATITIPYTSVDALAVSIFAAAVSSSKRLNKESIFAWFDSTRQDKLLQHIQAALGADGNDMSKLVRAVDSYRSKFAELSAPSPAVKQAEIESLLKVVAMVPDDTSEVTASIIKKLTVLQNKQNPELVSFNL